MKVPSWVRSVVTTLLGLLVLVVAVLVVKPAAPDSWGALLAVGVAMTVAGGSIFGRGDDSDEDRATSKPESVAADEDRDHHNDRGKGELGMLSALLVASAVLSCGVTWPATASEQASCWLAATQLAADVAQQVDAHGDVVARAVTIAARVRELFSVCFGGGSHG